MKNVISLIICLCTSQLNFAQLNDKQQAIVDSLNQELKEAQHDTTRADLNMSIATVYYINFQGGQLFADKALKTKEICERNLSQKLSIIERKKFKFILADAVNAIGLWHYSKGEIKETEALLLQSANIHFELKNYPQFLTIIYNLAAMYSGIEDIRKSMKYMQLVIKIAKSKEGRNENILAVALAQMGLDSDLIDPEVSEQYHQASYDLFVKLKDEHGQARQLLNLGYSQYEKANFERAEEYYRQSLDLSIESGDKVSEIRAYRALSEIYVKTDTNAAIHFYQKALEVSEFIEHIDMILSNQNSLAKIYLNRNFDSTKYYSNLNIKILENYPARPGTQHDISQLLTEIYSKSGNYREAYFEHKKYITLKDSLFNIENGQEIIRQNMGFEYAKKKAVDDKENEKKIAIERKDKEQQKIVTFASIAVLLLLLVFSIFIYNRFKITSKQKAIIQKQTDQIFESINYSQKIQQAILPPQQVMSSFFQSFFIFFRPKDIVSGDFYWFKEFESHLVLACVDCTGHGVPGGFMSTMGSLLLNKVVSENDKDPGEILKKLNKEIITTLRQKSEQGIQDGMDLSLCIIDKKEQQISFSGARNGIMLIRDNKAIRFKADLLPVGGNYLKKGKEIERDFKTETIKLLPDDEVFMYTDGFMEQCGQEENLPMNYSQFQAALIEVNNISELNKKEETLEQRFIEWRGTIAQSDDVLIIGFKIA